MSQGGRISIPEPKIEIYKDGFEGIDKLGRAADGKKLSDLVELISEPMVIAVDAPWGAGKSVFLKCWVGEHMKPDEVTTQTVYFDAFKHDFMDDPLVGLTGVISERFKGNRGKVSKLKAAKQAVSKLAKPAIRVGLAAATAGGTEVAGAMVDAGLKAGSTELAKASEEFWKREDGKRAAMEQFRSALSELAEQQKLVIVVDELDRCRPDYALNILEVIKHFFDVPNVHFVLGVNLTELANSVRARYGVGVSAERYLQKFITLSMPLGRNRHDAARERIDHLDWVARQLGVRSWWKIDWLSGYVAAVHHHAAPSLRDVEKLSSLAMVTPEVRDKPPARLHLQIGVLVLRVLFPEMVEKARNGHLSFEEVCMVFDFAAADASHYDLESARIVWGLATGHSALGVKDLGEALSHYYGNYDPTVLMREVIAETLDVFQLIQN